MKARVYEVVPRTERYGHGEEIVDWELWADRERTAFGWQGEYIDSFRTEEQAQIERRALMERQALAQRDPAQLQPGDLVLAPLGSVVSRDWWGASFTTEFSNGSGRCYHYRDRSPPWMVFVNRRDLEGREWERSANAVMDDFGDLVEVARA